MQTCFSKLIQSFALYVNASIRFQVFFHRVNYFITICTNRNFEVFLEIFRSYDLFVCTKVNKTSLNGLQMKTPDFA